MNLSPEQAITALVILSSVVLFVVIILSFIVLVNKYFSGTKSNSSGSKKWGLAGFHKDTRIKAPKNQTDMVITKETKPIQCEIGGVSSTIIKAHYPVLSLNGSGQEVLRRVVSIFESSESIPCFKITFENLNKPLIVSKSLSVFGVTEMGQKSLQVGKLKIGQRISGLKIIKIEDFKSKIRTFRFEKPGQVFFIEMDTVKIKCEGLGST